jgi:hypothetical protein
MALILTLPQEMSSTEGRREADACPTGQFRHVVAGLAAKPPIVVPALAGQPQGLPLPGAGHLGMDSAQRLRQAAQQRWGSENGAVHLNGDGPRVEQGAGIFDAVDSAATDEGHVHQGAYLQERMHG